MPILAEDQRAALAARLAEPDAAALSDADAAALLNAPASAPNPAPRGQVPKPFAFADVLGLLSPESITNVRALPTATVLIDRINAQDRAGVAHWVVALSAPPALITPAEAAAVTGVLQATVPDPAWPATVPGPSWAAATFAGVEFAVPGRSSTTGHDGTVTEHPTYVSGQVTPEMVAEARG